jgi:hypothetical protein
MNQSYEQLYLFICVVAGTVARVDVLRKADVSI